MRLTVSKKCEPQPSARCSEEHCLRDESGTSLEARCKGKHEVILQE